MNQNEQLSELAVRGTRIAAACRILDRIIDDLADESCGTIRQDLKNEAVLVLDTLQGIGNEVEPLFEQIGPPT
jgi:hypothetical protein